MPGSQVTNPSKANVVALPDEVVLRLGIPIRRTIATTCSDGRPGVLLVADPLTIRIGDQEMSVDCAVVPDGTYALVGQFVMEGLDLITDWLNQTLGPRPESPDRPLLLMWGMRFIILV